MENIKNENEEKILVRVEDALGKSLSMIVPGLESIQSKMGTKNACSAHGILFAIFSVLGDKKEAMKIGTQVLQMSKETSERCFDIFRVTALGIAVDFTENRINNVADFHQMDDMPFYADKELHGIVDLVSITRKYKNVSADLDNVAKA